MKFSTSDTATVKLTEAGRKILASPGLDSLITEPEGIFVAPLWLIMAVFGPRMLDGDNPFEFIEITSSMFANDEQH